MHQSGIPLKIMENTTLDLEYDDRTITFYKCRNAFTISRTCDSEIIVQCLISNRCGTNTKSVQRQRNTRNDFRMGFCVIMNTMLLKSFFLK